MTQKDAVILAAGRGDRLRGVAAPFHKPLMLVDGKPVILSAVDAALSSAVVRRVVIVAAPDNVVPMTHLLGDGRHAGDRITIVVQPKPAGPGAALLTAMHVVRTESVMVLLGDNVLRADDLDEHVEDFTIGWRDVPGTQAAQYTRHTHGPPAGWVEGPYPAPYLERDYTVWVGPLVLPSHHACRVLERHLGGDGELKIGAHLQEIVRAFGGEPVKHESRAWDVGMRPL